ncbi:MAG: T9SS type A sorting domain-containing protein [Bacteroidetes bacterium]|jgi:hypothetical protein|nr:T9SS type A sorting domain-containing protein [Bacteroidota bacterium]MBK7569126.1 T9SS type A sorting domain-containing protein [Bacteroidota bacterium]MBP8915210.1 T9SS type A sorting domain-containing protein [Chitinophagales bacterium]MBP9794500.1 T9SS type A sorting domain-containing protein [Chitinophagales bacterium]
MKKLLPITLSILAAGSIYAQPSLTSDEMLPFGSFMEFYYPDNLEVIDTTIQGADVTWDFSDFEPIFDEGATIEIVDPAETAHGDDFPESNYGYYEIYPGANAYRYFNLTTEKMERVGSYLSGTVNTFTDTQEEYIFPFELGVTNIDTWDNTESGFGGGDYNLECLGYGTLILPDMTTNDALMVRVHFTEGGIIDIKLFLWYSSDNGAILMQYIDGDGFWVGDNAIYLHSLEVYSGIHDEPITENIIYNNPVDNILNITFENFYTNGSYQIFNELGQVIKSEQISSTSTQWQIPVDDLTIGIYTVLITLDGKQPEAFRMVKM